MAIRYLDDGESARVPEGQSAPVGKRIRYLDEPEGASAAQGGLETPSAQRSPLKTGTGVIESGPVRVTTGGPRANYVADPATGRMVVFDSEASGQARTREVMGPGALRQAQGDPQGGSETFNGQRSSLNNGTEPGDRAPGLQKSGSGMPPYYAGLLKKGEEDPWAGRGVGLQGPAPVGGVISQNMPEAVGITAEPKPEEKPAGRTFTQGMKESWRRGDEGVALDREAFDAMMGSRPWEEVQAKRTAYRQKLESDPIGEEANWVERSAYGAAGMLPPMLRGLKQGAEAGLGAAVAAGIAGQIGPQIAAPEEVVTMPAAYAAGQTLGSFEYWARQGTGAIYGDLREAGVTHNTAKKVAPLGGLPYAAIEFSQVDKIFPGLGRKLKDVARQTIMKGLIKLIGRGVKNVGIQSLEEAEQSIITDTATAVGKYAEGQLENKEIPVETRKMLKNALDQFTQSLGPMALLQFPGGTVGAGRIVAEQTEAQRAAAMARGEMPFEPKETPPVQPVPPVPVSGKTPAAREQVKFTVAAPTDPNKQAAGRWAWVDLDNEQLKRARDKLRAIESGLQDRDRRRAASDEARAKRLREFNPTWLLDSLTSDRGAPILDAETRLPVAGYGRLDTLDDVYNLPEADPRRAALTQYYDQEGARLGVGPRPTNMTRPALVRMADAYTGTDKIEFARKSNENAAQGFSQSEQAGRDARMILDNNLLNALVVPESNDLMSRENKQFVAKYLELTQNSAEISDKNGKPIPELVDARLKRALLTILIKEHPAAPDVITAITERASDYGLVNMVDGLSAAAADLVQLKASRPDFDLTPELSATMPFVLEAKRAVLSGEFSDLKQYFQQQDFYRQATGEQQILAEILAKAKSAKWLREKLREYAEAARILDQGTKDMFAGQLPETRKIDLLQRIIKGGYGNENNQVDVTGGAAPEVPGGKIRRPGGKGAAKPPAPQPGSGQAPADQAEAKLKAAQDDLDKLMSEASPLLRSRSYGGQAGRRRIRSRRGVEGSPSFAPSAAGKAMEDRQGATEGKPGGDLIEAGPGKSGFRVRLEAIKEAKRGTARMDMRDVVQRGIQNKAAALIDALDAGRITEAEALVRFAEAERLAERDLARAERERQKAMPKPAAIDMFDRKTPAERGMLFEASPSDAQGAMEGKPGAAGAADSAAEDKKNRVIEAAARVVTTWAEKNDLKVTPELVEGFLKQKYGDKLKPIYGAIYAVARKETRATAETMPAGDAGGTAAGGDLAAAEQIKAEPISISGNEISSKKNMALFFENVKSWAKRRYLGKTKTVINKNDKQPIIITWQGIKSTLSHGYNRPKLQSLYSLEQLLAEAIYSYTETPHSGQPNVKAIHFYQAGINIGDTAHAVKIVVRETKDGRRFYDHAVVDKGPAGIPGNAAQGRRSLQPATSPLSEDKVTEDAEEGKQKSEENEEGQPTAPGVERSPRAGIESMPAGDAAGAGGGPRGPAPTGTGWPGGELGEPGQKVPVEDDRTYSALPIEMPELVQFGRALLEGKYPDVRRKMPGALGRFIHVDAGRPEAKIELLADVFQLVTAEERGRMMEEAKAWAEQHAEDGDNVAGLAQQRYEYMFNAAYEAAKKKNPLLASKVLAHEIGHAVSWLPDHVVRGRGNILGQIASFVNYTKGQLGKLPGQNNLINDFDRKNIRRLAQQRAKGDEAKAKEIYAGMIRAELRRRGLVTREEILDELEPLIAWWRGHETMEDYFKQPHEMYAEALSVLLNNPAAVAKRAPKFYGMFYGWLESKPEVKKRYNAVQDAINSGEIYKQRVETMYKEMEEADQAAAEWADARDHMTRQENIDRMIYAFDRRYGPIQRRLATIKDPEIRRRSLGALSDNNYRGAQAELILDRVQNEVAALLMENNFQWVNLGEYLLHQRIQFGDRANIGNPWGMTPKASLERLEEMRRAYGPARYGALEEASLWLRTIYEQEVLAPAREAGIYNEEMMQMLEDNVFYATFAVFKNQGRPGQDSLQAALADKFGAGVTSHIFKQYGTLKPVKNPATATVQKMLALSSMIYRERAKRQAVNAMLGTEYANEWRPAEMQWTGKRQEIKIIETARIGTLVYMHGGKLHGYYGPRALVDAFGHRYSIEVEMTAKAISTGTRYVKGMFTSANPAFWPVAWIRDVRGFNRRMPGTSTELRNWIPMTGGVYGRYMPKAFMASSRMFSGRPDAIGQEALRRGMVISRQAGYMGQAEDEEFEREIKRRGLPVLMQEDLPKVTKALNLAHKWMELGQVLERTSKIAGMLYLDEKYPNMNEDLKRAIVRKWAGSPDFLEKAAWGWVVDQAFLFYGPAKEGLRSEVQAWKGFSGEPGRAGEMFWNTVRWTILPRLGITFLFTGGLAALLGKGGGDDDDDDDASKMYADGPSERDKRTYLCIPLGWADKAEHKAIYLRWPLEESERMISATADTALTAARTGKPGEILPAMTDYAGRQLPGINPLWSLAEDWGIYILGGNPFDKFRKRNVLDSSEQKAGGVHGFKAMLRHTWNALPGALVGQIPAPETPMDAATTKLEKLLRLPGMSNVVGRWIRVSNAGYRERLEKASKPIEKREAEIQIEVDRAVVDFKKSGKLDQDAATRIAQGKYLADQFKGAPLPEDLHLQRYYYVRFKSAIENASLSMEPIEIRMIKRQESQGQRQAVIREILRK